MKMACFEVFTPIFIVYLWKFCVDFMLMCMFQMNVLCDMFEDFL